MSKENMTKSDNNFVPTFVNFNLLSEIHLDAYCLMNNISIHKTVINLYIS